MAKSSTIREFLVKLGFKTDEPALKRFKDGIGDASTAVMRLAVVTTAAATAVTAAVQRWSSNLEQLYFASQRTNSSAANLSAFDRAAQNFGTSAGEAQASIEGLAHALRVNPGNENFLDSMLVKVGARARDSKGHLRDLADVAVDLGKVFAHEPTWLAEQQSSMLGISEKTMLAMRDGSFGPEYARQQKEAAGLNAAAEKSHAFEKSWRDMSYSIQSALLPVLIQLQSIFGPLMVRFSAWLDKNHDAAINSINSAITTMKPAVEWVIGAFKDADKATGGWSTRLLIILGVLKAFGATGLITGVLGVTSAVLKLGGALVGLATGGSAAAGGAAAATAGGAAAGAGGLGMGAILARLGLAGFAAATVGTAGYAAYKAAKGEDASNWISTLGGTYDIADKLSGAMIDQEDRPGQAMRFFMGRGWTKSQAAGLVANIQAESNFSKKANGDNGAAYGIAQWHPDRQADFRKLFGISMMQSSYEQQLEFMDYELRHGKEQKAGAMLRAATNAAQAGAAVSRYDIRPRDADAQAAARGSIAMHYDTTVNVHGVDDPTKAAALVANAQRGVAADSTRNLAGTMQ